MQRLSEYTVWGGVVTGMDLCQSSDVPLNTLGWFLGSLRRIGWHPSDVRMVEQCILELLQWKKDQGTSQVGRSTNNRVGLATLGNPFPTVFSAPLARG